MIKRGSASDRRGNPSGLAQRGQLVSSLTGSRWIATGFRPRDDKAFCHCEEDSMDDAAIHRVSGDVGRLSVRVVRASGSPRPQGARDDKSGYGGSAVRLLRTIGSPRAFSPRDNKGG